jgi:bifunctional pyridoxal-dependent enzyme with beta-cystathionase and maltose regulon repressor activities
MNNGKMSEFDILIDHEGLASGRDLFRPKQARDNGLPSFSFAETDFMVPSFFRDAMHELIDRGFMGYTVAGDDGYMDAVREWFRNYHGFEPEREWIIPVYGVLRTMSMTIRAFSKEGEGVIILSPGYMAYEGLIENNKRKLIRSSLLIGEDEFLINWKDLEEKMSDQNNRILFLCNAHNPTMHFWSMEDLSRIADLSDRYGTYVVVDETFYDLYMDIKKASSYGAMEKGRKGAVIINALSKAFNITGLNAANAIIPDEETREKFLKTFRAEQRGSGSIEPIMRTAVMSLYSENGRRWLDSLMEYVRENIRVLEAFFSEYRPDIRVFRYDVAYLVWVDWRSLGLSDEELEDLLFNDALMCVDMGYKYGPEGKGFTRIHLGTSRKNVKEAVERLKKAMREKHLI